MKTFADYINEKQNFIFGGKANLTGKEYINDKNYKKFSDLKIGEVVYCCTLYKGTGSISKHDPRKIKDIGLTKKKEQVFFRDGGVITLKSELKDDDTYVVEHELAYTVFTTYSNDDDYMREKVESLSQDKKIRYDL